MPTNLPPDYYTVEKEFRVAKETDEKIALLEEMMQLIPKHKGTEHLRGDLKRRLAKLRDRTESTKGSGKHESPYHIPREGAGQVVVIGPPNVGKSSLVAAVSNAEPDIGAYPFTTWTPTPGMMTVRDIQIQLVDTPALSAEHIEHMLLDMIRRTDLLLLMVDIQDYPIQQLEETLALLAEHRIYPEAESEHREIERRTAFKRIIVVANKVDDEEGDADFEVLQELLGDDWHLLPISAQSKRYLTGLGEALFDALEVMRVYAKKPGHEPDMSAPFALKRGDTVEDFAIGVHRDLAEQLKSARVWGADVHDGQMVGRDHVLHDGDIVELRA